MRSTVRDVLGVRLRRRLAIVLVLAAAGCGDDDSRTVTGVVNGVSASGVGIGLDEGGDAGEGYVVGNGVEWVGVDGSTRESGQPECLPPMSMGAEVVLHLVRYGSREHVVRVECLTLPTEVHTGGGEVAAPFHPYCDALERLGQRVPLAPDGVDPCAD